MHFSDRYEEAEGTTKKPQNDEYFNNGFGFDGQNGM